MKKIIVICFAFTAICASCSKETNVQKKRTNTISASLELNGTTQTKTSLSKKNEVLWSSGDVISVFDTDGTNYEYTLTKGAGTKSGTFNGEECTPACALFPYSKSASVTGSMVTFTLPSSQDYAAGSFAQNANVLIAQIVGETKTVFKNVCGVLCLPIIGNYRVSRIVLTGKTATDYLCGTFKADASLAAPVITYDSNGSTSVTLNCNGVQLNSTEPTLFYIVVPAGALASGFTAAIYDDVDDNINEIIETSKPQLIKRNVIRMMANNTVSHIKNVVGVKELTYLKGAASGEVAINSKLKADNNTRVRCFGYTESNRTFFGTWSNPHFYYRLSGLPGVTVREEVAFSALYQNDPDIKAKFQIWTTQDLSASGWYKNGECLAGPFSNTFTCTANMGVMGSIGAPGDANALYDCLTDNGKMKYCQVWQNGTLVRYFIPCITTEVMDNVEGESMPVGTLGMYEIVDGALYTSCSLSTGDFTYDAVM